jgi:hypothetical protein
MKTIDLTDGFDQKGPHKVEKTGRLSIQMDLGSTEIICHPVAVFGRAPTEIVYRGLDLTVLTPDDWSTSSGWLHPCSAGRDLSLRLHTAGLVDCAGGGAFAAVIRSSPQSGREASWRTENFRRLEAFENSWWRQARRSDRGGCVSDRKERSEDFGEVVETLADRIEQLRQKVACFFDCLLGGMAVMTTINES